MKKVLDYIVMLYIPMAMASMVFISLLQFYVTLDDEIGGLFLNIAGILSVLMVAGHIALAIMDAICYGKENEK